MQLKSPKTLFLTPDIEMTQTQDGCSYLYSKHCLSDAPPSILDYLEGWARHQPDQVFLAERSRTEPDKWRCVRYGELYQQIHLLAVKLEDAGLSEQRPLMLLSGNSIAFAQMMLASMLIKAPVVPVSPSYSLLSEDFTKIKYIHEQVQPGLVFAEDEQAFRGALDLVAAKGSAIVTASGEATQGADHNLAKWLAEQDKERAPYKSGSIASETVAKILFTSGSTGMPKGVINTQGMLTSNQEMIAAIWPFIEQPGHVFLDWLPWHHTFGGNHNFNMVLRNGGTLYIDAGKPTPQGMPTTITNLREIAPTVYFNVAAGYELLVAHLEEDEVLATQFFSQLRLLFFAAAALPATTWKRLQALIDKYAPGPIPITSSWGATETAPLCTSVYFPNNLPRNIGVPVPGVQVKLAPVGDLTELRVKGPNIMPGYWRDAQKSAAVFDEEGYFCSGDAVELINPDSPNAGMLFKGRVSENFKLLTGTWVNVGELRIALLEALSPLASDLVICGHNESYVALLIFPNFEACARIAAMQENSDLSRAPRLKEEIAKRISLYNRTQSGSSRQIKRALLLKTPPSIDRNEMTDKGYLNQRGVIACRAGEVALLYQSQLEESVIEIATD